MCHPPQGRLTYHHFPSVHENQDPLESKFKPRPSPSVAAEMISATLPHVSRVLGHCLRYESLRPSILIHTWRFLSADLLLLHTLSTCSLGPCGGLCPYLPHTPSPENRLTHPAYEEKHVTKVGHKH